MLNGGRSEWALDGAFGKGRHGKQRPSEAFAPYGFPFLFFLSSLFFFSPPPPSHLHSSHHFLSKHYMYYVPHLRSRWISGAHLGGRDEGQPGATRCSLSNATDDAGLGQRRNIPTLLLRWLCLVTRSAFGPGIARRLWAAPGAWRKRDLLRYLGITSLATNQPISSIM